MAGPSRPYNILDYPVGATLWSPLHQHELEQHYLKGNTLRWL
jgi:hypothetical protein